MGAPALGPGGAQGLQIALGDLAGVETPGIDALVQLCSVLMGIDYAATGLTLARM